MRRVKGRFTDNGNRFGRNTARRHEIQRFADASRKTAVMFTLQRIFNKAQIPLLDFVQIRKAAL